MIMVKTGKSCQDWAGLACVSPYLGLSSCMGRSRRTLRCTDRFSLEHRLVIGHNAPQNALIEAAASRQSDHALAGQDAAIVGVHQDGPRHGL